MVGEDGREGASSDHGPVCREPPEKNKAPELGPTVSGWLLIVLRSEASVVWLISEVWVRAPILRVFGRVLLLGCADCILIYAA